MPSNAPTEELSAWLRLSLQVPRATALRLLRHVGGPQRIFASDWQDIARHTDAALARRIARAPDAQVAAAIDLALQWSTHPGHALLPLTAPQYPAHLLAMVDAPLLLYVDGQLWPLAQPGIAIVGARRASIQGRTNAHAFACALSRQGLSIISGLAAGIDAAAHEGALAAGCTGAGTIAVMGTGLNRVYPAAHADLAERIRHHGALVSELPLDMPARPHQFPMRNRIVAGLAKGILVIEAAARSGSLITARLGNEAGRDVFALPGSIHAPLARGCHALIRQGAKLVETPDDVLEEFEAYPGAQPRLPTELACAGKPRSLPAQPAPRSVPARSPLQAAPSTARATTTDADAACATVTHPDADAACAGATATYPDADAACASATATYPDADAACASATATATDADTLLASMGYEPISLDALIIHAGHSPAALARRLLALELSGAIVRLADGRYQRLQR